MNTVENGYKMYKSTLIVSSIVAMVSAVRGSG